MLLKEILDEPYKSNDFASDKSVPDVPLPKDRLQRIGQGYYSDVYSVKDNPHEVIKHSSAVTGVKAFEKEPDLYSDYDEGFKYYAEAILADNSAAMNPYFPRIRAYNINNKEHKYVIETLQPINSVIHWVDPEEDSEEFKHQISIVDSLGEQIFSNWEAITHYRHNNTGATKLLSTIIEYIGYVCGGSHYGSIKDANLIQAISLIREIKSKNRTLIVDIHKENLMFRMTRNGVQLVITDPFTAW